MSQQIYVKPGLLPDGSVMHLRDEYTKQVIPAEGKSVKRTTLVDRRLIRGELILCDAPEPAAETVPAKGSKRIEKFADKAGE